MAAPTMITPVAAAASVPSSSTATKALCTTSLMNKSGFPVMPEKSALSVKQPAFPTRSAHPLD